MSGFASLRVCTFFGLLCGDKLADNGIDGDDQGNQRPTLLPSVSPTPQQSSWIPSDVPSLLPSIDPTLSGISTGPPGDPSNVPSDAPSLMPTGGWDNPAKAVPPSRSSSPVGSFPLASPDDKSTFPPPVEYSSAIPTAMQQRDFRAETTDAAFVITLSAFIIVCSLAVAGMGLYIIVQKIKERRNRAFSSLSISSGQECGSGDDDNEGRASIHRAETVSSLSSAWKEDLYAEFGVLQNLAHPSSPSARGRPSHPENDPGPIGRLASRMRETTGDGTDDLMYDPEHSVNESTAHEINSDGDQLSTIVLAEPAQKANPVSWGPTQPFNNWSSGTTSLVHDGHPSLNSQPEDVSSFAESSVTLNSFDQLVEEYEIPLDQWLQRGEF
jgi:hypothetical protein